MYGWYTVAVCDVLGFSDLVNKTDLGTLVDDHLAKLQGCLSHSIHKQIFSNQVPSLTEITAHPKVGIAWFSDTVLLYTREDNDACLQELYATVGWLLFETLIQSRTRIRAGIAYGEAFIDAPNSLYVGRPIIEAHCLEQRQQWSGAALAPSAVDRTPLCVRDGDFADWWLVRYDVPLKKKGLTCDTFAVDWTIGVHQPGTFPRWSAESAEPTAADWRTKESVCQKWKNTRKFHDEICRQCR